PFTPAFLGQAFPAQEFPGQAFPGQPYQQVFPGQPSNHQSSQQTTNLPPQDSSNAPAIKPSTAPSDCGAPIDDFLTFTQLGPSSTLVIDDLNHLSSTHWSLLQHVTVDELIQAGIPLAQARAIMLAFGQYSKHLKTLANTKNLN
ncbi:hypothetical protein PSTT_08295, partial [Puccinia striiformis]